MKAFGDMMGQTARLQLIRDRFIAGNSSCVLRRYLDSVPPETPIRDVVDRCRVWESHADPEIRRVSKPGPEPVYPAYVVGESDEGVDEVQVPTVNQPKSPPDQVEDLLRRLLYGSPGSGSSSGSGGSYGEKVTAASGGGEPETSAGACDSGQACGVGETAPIVPLGAADFGTTVSAETR